MKKILTMAFACLFAVVALSSCENDPDNPNNAVPDPAGTITANISEDVEIGFSYYGGIRWQRPNNFYCDAIHYPFDPDPSYYVSICDLGPMRGLGNITTIPSTGFTSPSGSNDDVACEAGHGYVVKFESVNNTNIRLYVLLYVVEPIVSVNDGIIGAKVKYIIRE